MLAVLFVALFNWYAGDFLAEPTEKPATNSWPDDVNRSTLDWIEETSNLEKFPENDSDVFRFWYMASLDNSYIATVRITSHVSASVSVTSLTYGVEPLRGKFSGALSQAEIDELLMVLDFVEFWSTPPGPLGWTCTDGEGFVAETNIGDRYRVWANACETSPAMSPIADFFHKTVSRVTSGEFGRL